MYVSIQCYFKEKDEGKGANVAISGSTSVAMVEIEDKRKKMSQHMMSFPSSPDDLSVPRAISDSQTLASGSLERLPYLEMATMRCLADTTYETESEWTESSGFYQERAIEGGIDEKEAFIYSLTVQPIKTTQSFLFPESTGVLDTECQPRTMRVRNINSTAGGYVPQSEESFKMSTAVKSEVKGQTKKKPLPTPQLSVSTLKNSTAFSMNTATNVPLTDILKTANEKSQTKSIEDSITAPSGSPQNLNNVTETSTGRTSVSKVKSQEKNKEIRVTFSPGEASTALREREQENIKDTDETLQIRREQKASVNGESETDDCYSGAIAACPGHPTTAPSITTENRCK